MLAENTRTHRTTICSRLVSSRSNLTVSTVPNLHTTRSASECRGKVVVWSRQWGAVLAPRPQTISLVLKVGCEL